jgi:hypothetical protein
VRSRLRTNSLELLDLAERGEEIIITTASKWPASGPFKSLLIVKLPVALSPRLRR